MKVIFTTTKNCTDLIREENKRFYYYPETTLSVLEQMNFKPENIDQRGTVIYTNSVFIISNFDKSQVFIYDAENDNFYNPDFQTFGASYDELLFQLLNVRANISPLAVKGIREKQKEGDHAALEYVKSLGKSSTKAYMIRVLENNLN